MNHMSLKKCLGVKKIVVKVLVMEEMDKEERFEVNELSQQTG